MKNVRINSVTEQFLKALGTPHANAAIRSVAMIGALASEEPKPDDSFVELYPSDEEYLQAMLQLLKNKSLSFSKRLGVKLYNRRYDVVGGDFLQSTLKADALLFCLLYWNKEEFFQHTGFGGQSALALDPENWRKAMLDSGANVAVNVTLEKKELPTEFAAQEPFVLVAKEHIGFDQKQQHLIVRRGWQPGQHLIV